ncbi:MAG: hypothetical protein GX493_00345 [Firmicutes bacterium]|nr:hypothetical protein [Bacillota bacterium]
MNPRLQEWLARRGYRMAVGDPGVLSEVRAEIQGRAAAHELEENFFRTHLSGFRYDAEDESFQGPGTMIILLAVPRPAHRISFRLGNGTLEAVLPPTYLFYRRLCEEIRAELVALLGEGIRLAVLDAPFKALAVRLGLAAYGRNNLAYVPGMGSYHQLVGFLVEGMEFSASESRPAHLLPACRTCQACRRACPTGAIGSDRLLLHAERCLTFINEEPGPWPEWVPKTAHRCLVGCLACQEACPENRGLLVFNELEEGFSPEETQRLLRGPGQVEGDSLWAAVKQKLAAMGLPGYEEILGRNLAVLLGQHP